MKESGEMAAEIHQHIASGLYDPQHIKAMSQMWNFEQYQQYPKDEKMLQFHPLFAHHMSSFTGMQSARESPCPSKKKPQPVPDEQKDENYRERRRRNNEAARKSREARRWKEETTSKRLEESQRENFRLRQQVHHLQMELHELRCTVAMNNISMASISAASSTNSY
ncbi:unnamed protein product [Caenorhabditis auriculariae]|uniref:BZIP domain-containing protein n=1 Tax=Caenorhabditis auriculariae TaxID=2777116 RepID=A0A8S1HQ49_9PELO|nr:unnamed protein product [Caenorhabditis auriculariae]